jgi:hypothetical protein
MPPASAAALVIDVLSRPQEWDSAAEVKQALGAQRVPNGWTHAIAID